MGIATFAIRLMYGNTIKLEYLNSNVFKGSDGGNAFDARIASEEYWYGDVPQGGKGKAWEGKIMGIGFGLPDLGKFMKNVITKSGMDYGGGEIRTEIKQIHPKTK